MKEKKEMGKRMTINAKDAFLCHIKDKPCVFRSMVHLIDRYGKIVSSFNFINDNKCECIDDSFLQWLDFDIGPSDKLLGTIIHYDDSYSYLIDNEWKYYEYSSDLLKTAIDYELPFFNAGLQEPITPKFLKKINDRLNTYLSLNENSFDNMPTKIEAKYHAFAMSIILKQAMEKYCYPDDDSFDGSIDRSNIQMILRS